MIRSALFLALVAATGAARAQATAAATVPHDIPRLSAPIVIDGQVDDAGWASAAEYDLG